MIVQEQIDGRNLIKTYSNIGKWVQQVETGAVYGEAIDIIPCPYTYIEVEAPLDDEDDPTESERILDILLGDA